MTYQHQCTERTSKILRDLLTQKSGLEQALYNVKTRLSAIVDQQIIEHIPAVNISHLSSSKVEVKLDNPEWVEIQVTPPEKKETENGRQAENKPNG